MFFSFEVSFISFEERAAIWSTNGKKIIVAQTLKIVCSMEMWVVIFDAGVPGTIKSTNDKKGLNMHKTIKVPVTLNPTWTSAVLFELTDAPKLDITASIVEPMLLPKTSAALNSQLSEPFAAIVRTIAVIAEDE